MFSPPWKPDMVFSLLPNANLVYNKRKKEKEKQNSEGFRLLYLTLYDPNDP